MSNDMLKENVQFFKQGCVIIKEDDPSDNIYLIRDGYVKIIKNFGNPKENIIAVIGPGETFGELGIILHRNRQATVIAKSDIEVEIIDPELFVKIFETPLGKKLQPVFQSMAERIRISGIKMSEFVSDNYRENNELGEVSIDLVAASEVAIRLMQGRESLKIKKFPFKVGRYSKKKSDILFRRNDLYLVESEPYILSLSHFILNYEAGSFIYVDRSDIGSIVNGEKLGGLDDNCVRKVTLRSGENHIILGKEHYDVAFRIIV